MRYIISLLFLTSVAVATAPKYQDQPLALEKKIQALEKELEEMRRQTHVKNRERGVHQKTESAAADNKPHALRAPKKQEANSPETMASIEKEEMEAALSEEGGLYVQGRHYVAQQRLDLARKSFDEVVKKYDGTPESILARFWIGEFMLRDKNYAGASIALGQAYGALKKLQHKKEFSTDVFHGEADRLPEILAKLAYALKMINKRQDACITLRQLKKESKKRPANLEWYIKKLSKELKCR